MKKIFFLISVLTVLMCSSTTLAEFSNENYFRIQSIKSDLLSVSPDLIILKENQDNINYEGIDQKLFQNLNNKYLFSYYRGQIWTQTLKHSYDLVSAAIESKDYETINNWMNIRDFNFASRVSRPELEIPQAFKDFVGNKLSPEEFKEIYEIEVLGTYQVKLNFHLTEAKKAVQKNFTNSFAYNLGLAKGYLYLLENKFSEQNKTDIYSKLVSEIELSLNSSDKIDNIKIELEKFQAVPLSNSKLKKKVSQLDKFLQLIPIEYKRGVRPNEVFLDIELQEAISFLKSSTSTFSEIQNYFPDKNISAQLKKDILLLDSYLTKTNQRKSNSDIVHPKNIQDLTNKIRDQLHLSFDKEWFTDKGADYDLIYTILIQLENSYKEQNYEQAELNRIEAYGYFDLGPELRLIVAAPYLVAEIDGKFWQGYKDQIGLANLIAQKAPLQDVQNAIKSLRKSLQNSELVLGKNQSPIVTIINAAIIVFREGLEAIMVIFALIVSLNFKKESKGYKKPLVVGVVSGLIATIVTWLIAQQILSSFIAYGERLEAVVSAIAIFVLLLITNWFFHDLYWIKWNHKIQSKKHEIIVKTKSADIVKRSAFFGFFLLGVTSIYREGFETVLFLQVLVLDSGLQIVLQGLALGSILLGIIGFVIFYLQKRIPYLPLLVATGLLMVLILVMMTGQTVHTMQAVGWINISPIANIQIPYWVGLWFGIYATWQTILAQVFVVVIVGGSYLAAEYIKKLKGLKTQSLTKKLGF